MTFTRPNLKKQKINNKTVKWENGDKKKETKWRRKDGLRTQEIGKRNKKD